MRPIDADALIEVFANLIPWCIDTQEEIAFTNGLSSAYEATNNAPTIDAVPQWIPCEERLPENKSEVLVTDMNGHIRHALYNAVWDRFGTYEESMTVRAIAWMPLPEPYEGERKDDE